MRARSAAFCTSLSLLLGCQHYTLKSEIHDQEENIQTSKLQIKKKHVTAEAQSLADCAKEPSGAMCDQTELGLRKQLGELRQKARVAIQKQYKQELDAQVNQLQSVLAQYDRCVTECKEQLDCRAKCKTSNVTAVIQKTQELLRKGPGAAPADDDEEVTTSCKQWQQKARAQNVYIFDGRTETLNPPSGIQYDTKPVYVCIENANYAVRYQVATTATALPAQDYTSGLASLIVPAEPKSGAAATQGISRKQVQDAYNETDPAQAKLKKLAEDSDFMEATARFIEGLDADTKKKLAGGVFSGLPVGKGKVQEKLSTQDLKLLKTTLKEIDSDTKLSDKYFASLDQYFSSKKPGPAEPQPPKLEAERAAVVTAMATFQEARTSLSAPFLSRARFVKLVKELAAHQKKLREAYAALASSEQAQDKDKDKAGGETDKSLAEAALRLLNTLATLEEQLESFGGQPLHFPVAVERDKEMAIVVNGARLKLRQDAEQKTESMMVFGDSRVLARTAVQIRTLVYVRASLGLAWTSLNNPSYSVAPNQEGTQVLSASQSAELVPMLVLSHYWTGADLRALQPWDKNRAGWWKNLFPTFAIGIPLNKSPFENFFVGAQLQPVPGLSVIGGAHIGKVNVLRDGFTVGAAVPASFRATDAAEQAYRPGGFVGVAIMDSLFVKLILSLIGTPK